VYEDGGRTFTILYISNFLGEIMKNKQSAFNKIFSRSLISKSIALAIAVPALTISQAYSSEEAASEEDEDQQVVLILGKKATFASAYTSDDMVEQEAVGSSVLNMIKNIPGVIISQGALFGSDDNTTAISMRGFSTGQNEQQIGMTIDGLPNGNSNYGGGSKANRYIDSPNMLYAEVSQGTADLSSPSHEALGGTINFVSKNPADDFGVTANVSLGTSKANASYYFARVDTGEFADNTFAYFSASTMKADSWMDGLGDMKRDHISAKVISDVGDWSFTGRFSWDDADEFDYKYTTLERFKLNPDSDFKETVWQGIPRIDQNFRGNARTLRENTFIYLKSEYENNGYKFAITPYFHDMTGRGDWTPSYVWNPSGTSTIPGSSLSENGPNTLYGGTAPFSDAIFYTTPGSSIAPNATPATFIEGCTSTTFSILEGEGNGRRHPNCYPEGSLPAMSMRHTHYAKQRLGFTSDFEMEISEGNTIKTGIWVEQTDRDEARDAHQVINPLVFRDYYPEAYWVVYDRSFETDSKMFYLQDTLETGDFVFQGGIKKFFVDIDRVDNFRVQDAVSINSDSDLLFALGAVYTASSDLEIFAGYSQGFAPIKTDVIENQTNDPADPSLDPTSADSLARLEGETTDNVELGLRYSDGKYVATLTAYKIVFENRITSVKPVNELGEPLSDDDDVFLNVGGVESQGIEASLSVALNDSWDVYSSITLNDATYKNEGDIGGVTDGNEVLLSPKFQFVSTLTYAADNFNAGLSGKYVGAYYGDFDNTEELPSSLVFDLWAGYRFNISETDMKVSLNVSNLFDEDYLDGGKAGLYNIGVGRQIMLNLELEL